MAIRVALLALLALLVLLCGLLFHQYRILRGEVLMNGHLHLLSPRGNAAPLTDTSLIQSWMTFDYIGHVYGLPRDYLKTTLSITDPNYPHVTIAGSSAAQHESAVVLTAQVQAAVSNYLVTTGR